VSMISGVIYATLHIE